MKTFSPYTQRRIDKKQLKLIESIFPPLKGKVKVVRGHLVISHSLLGILIKDYRFKIPGKFVPLPRRPGEEGIIFGLKVVTDKRLVPKEEKIVKKYKTFNPTRR